MYSETVYVRMSKEDTAALDQRAALEGRSRSSMVREIIRHDLNKFNFSIHKVITLANEKVDEQSNYCLRDKELLSIVVKAIQEINNKMDYKGESD